MALCGYIALEETMDLSYDGLLDEWILSTPHVDIATIHLLQCVLPLTTPCQCSLKMTIKMVGTYHISLL